MKKEITSLLFVGAAVTAAQAAEPERPNFVLFIADDCSYTDLGCYGGENVSTPRIDQFAKEGILFEKGYQAAPMSSPTRHNLFTGIWPVKSGAYPNHTHCNRGVQSVVHHLRPLGYKVALIGKKHIGNDATFPFDLYAMPADGGDINYEAINKFIDECVANGDPYCLFVTSNQPHAPWNKGDVAKIDADKLKLPPYYVDCQQTRSEYRNYLAEVNYMDSEFGNVLDMLEEKDQTDKSVVVYLSEQGSGLPFAKWTCYDVGVHSAYIVRWPDKIKPNTTSDAIVEYVDITPTFVDIAGGELVSPVDGKSIKDVLLGKSKSHKKYTYSLQTTRGVNDGSKHYGIRSVADSRYRYIRNLTPEVAFKNGLTSSALFDAWHAAADAGDAKAKTLVHNYQYRPAEELYDLDNDPHCMNNLIDSPKLKSKRTELSNALATWMQECGDEGQQTEMDAYYHVNEGVKRKIEAIDRATK